MSVKTNRTRSKRSLWLSAVAFFGLVVLYLGIASLLNLWPLQNDRSGQEPPAKTTSTAPSAQDDFKGGEKVVPETTPESTARGIDQKGVIATAPSSSQWTRSSDGSSIVVYGPSANSLFTSGNSVFGSAKADSVSYRMTGNNTGLVASGVASVVNGKFSIKLVFSTSDTKGNIEIFNQSNPYSTESNNVIIPVVFK